MGIFQRIIIWVRPIEIDEKHDNLPIYFYNDFQFATVNDQILHLYIR